MVVEGADAWMGVNARTGGTAKIDLGTADLTAVHPLAERGCWWLLGLITSAPSGAAGPAAGAHGAAPS